MAHVSNSFIFHGKCATARRGAAFGPEGERLGWRGLETAIRLPYSAAGRQRVGVPPETRRAHRGMGKHALRPDAGRMQYVYVLGDLLVTKIDVRLHAIDATHTRLK